ncbi:hypothetical protein MMC10_006128 [Thelotrema lepadinum]|nr:hypothetical protein [Thelotrema lepadinum]
MVYFKDLQQYTHQSQLLLSARPATTKITTRYTIFPPSKSQLRRSHKKPAPTDDATTTEAAPSSQATLTLKTYDPISGVVLKYRTDRAADVGRLMAGLSACGRVMAALPDVGGGGEGGDMAAAAETTGAAEERVGVDGGSSKAGAGSGGQQQQAQQQAQQGQQQGKGGGGKKKKKR